MTPKRPEATCLILEFKLRPSGCTLKRLRFSPPSPELDLAPIEFIASAIVSCASLESEPKLMAPTLKRLTIASAGSTSERSTFGRSDLNSQIERSVVGVDKASLSNSAVYSLKSL